YADLHIQLTDIRKFSVPITSIPKCLIRPVYSRSFNDTVHKVAVSFNDNLIISPGVGVKLNPCAFCTQFIAGTFHALYANVIHRWLDSIGVEPNFFGSSAAPISNKITIVLGCYVPYRGGLGHRRIRFRIKELVSNRFRSVQLAGVPHGRVSPAYTFIAGRCLIVIPVSSIHYAFVIGKKRKAQPVLTVVVNTILITVFGSHKHLPVISPCFCSRRQVMIHYTCINPAGYKIRFSSINNRYVPSIYTMAIGGRHILFPRAISNIYTV